MGGQGLPRPGRRLQRPQRREAAAASAAAAARSCSAATGTPASPRTDSARTRRSSTCRPGRAARRSPSARRARRCTSPRRPSSRTSPRPTSTSSPGPTAGKALVDTQQVPAATDATAKPGDPLGQEVMTGWQKLVNDGGLTLYPDWSSPTMLQTMGQTFQEMLAGRITPAGRRQPRPEGLGGVRQGARGELARGRAVLHRCRRAGPVARARRGRGAAGSRVRVRAPGEPRKVAYLYLAPAFLFYLLFAFGPLVYTAWLSLFDWDGLTVGTWTGLDNYRKVLSDPDIRASFVHSFELIFFYAVLPVILGLLLASVIAHGARAGRHVLPRRAVPAADRRDRRRGDRLGVDLRAGRAAQRGAAGDRAGRAHAQLARRLHLGAARARAGRDLGHLRPVPRAVPGRHPEDPATRCTRPRASTAPATSASSSRSRCRACGGSWPSRSRSP